MYSRPIMPTDVKDHNMFEFVDKLVFIENINDNYLKMCGDDYIDVIEGHLKSEINSAVMQFMKLRPFEVLVPIISPPFTTRNHKTLQTEIHQSVSMYKCIIQVMDNEKEIKPVDKDKVLGLKNNTTEEQL